MCRRKDAFMVMLDQAKVQNVHADWFVPLSGAADTVGSAASIVKLQCDT